MVPWFVLAWSIFFSGNKITCKINSGKVWKREREKKIKLEFSFIIGEAVDPFPTRKDTR